MSEPKTRDIYFTIETNPSGFTDMLSQFSTMFKLGQHLGYKYFHRSFQSSRSTSPSNIKELDIFDQIGFNSYYFSKNDSIVFKASNSIEIHLNQIVSTNRITSLENLTQYIYEIVQKHEWYQDQNKMLVFSEKKVTHRSTSNHYLLSIHKRILNALKLKSISRDLDNKNFYSMINSKIPRILDLGFYSIFSKLSSQTEDITSPLNVLTHLRYGDTATFLTPWDTYVPLYYKESLRFKELTSEKHLKRIPIWPSEVAAILKILYDSLREQIAIKTYSDGYQRALNMLKMKVNRLNLTNEKSRMLNELDIDTYECNMFLEFKEFPNELSIGEKRLFKLITEIFNSKIVITNGVQVMIPNLMAICFENAETRPWLIVLYKKTRPSYYFIGFEHWSEKVVFIDLLDNRTNPSKEIERICRMVITKSQVPE